MTTTEEIIKQAIEKGYTEGVMFYDAIYKRPFIIKSGDFNDFSMDGFKLYIKVFENPGYLNKSACIYYNGRWAKIEGEKEIVSKDEDNFYLNLLDYERKTQKGLFGNK